MNEGVKGWLELQRDLGGNEVIFATPLEAGTDLTVSDDVSDANVASPRPLRAVAPEAAMRTPRPVEARPDAPPPMAPAREWRLELTGDPESAWRKALLPIPGPGFAITMPPPPPGTPVWQSLEDVATTVASCIRCPLCRSRTKTVPGEGDPAARLFCVGEGPGEAEDLSGRPFVGRAGELLDKILDTIEVPRSGVYIGNVVKCRPPKNRTPLPDEREACMPYLRRQIALVKPKVILALGTTAAEALLGVRKPLGDLRMKVHLLDGIPLVVTYHPAALLRNPNWKRPAWDDVRIARQLLDSVD